MNRVEALIVVAVLCAVALVDYAHADENYTWDSVAIGGGGFVSGIITSKTEQNLMYVRTDVGGAYRWDNVASRWVSLLDWVSENEMGFMGVESIAIDSTSPNKVYMLVGTSYFNNGKTAILKSNDYGKTFSVIDVTSQFKAHGNGMGRNAGEKLQVDSANGNILYVGTRANGIFKSTDAGLTWSRSTGLNLTTTPSGNGISFVVLDSNSVSGGATQKIFVGVSRYGSVGANFYMSSDAGQSFTAIAGSPANLMPQRAVLAGGDLIITYANGAGPWGDTNINEGMDVGQVWKYNVATGAWTNITPSNFNRAYSGISVDPNDAKHMVVSSINYYAIQYGNAWGDKIFSTTDGGVTWVDVVARGFVMDTKGIAWASNNSIHWAASIEFDPFDTKTVYVVSGNGLFKTSNIDAVPTTWAFHVAGLEETVVQNFVSIPNGPIISVIGDYDGFRNTDPAVYGQMHSPSMGTTTGLDVAAQNTNVLARAGDSLYLSNDMGLTWTKTAVINGRKGQVALSADGKALLHSPEDSTVSYSTTNSGASWNVISGLTVKNARPVADPVNANKFYALNGGAMMVSTNSGVSFAAAGSLPNNYGSKVIRVAPGHEGDVWVALYDGGLTRSTNSGASFNKLSNVSHAGAVGFGKTLEGANYPTVFIWGTVNGVTGLFRSTDIGATWVRINDDAHEFGGPVGNFVVGDMNNFGVVYMSSPGRGIVYGKPMTSGLSSRSSSSSISSISSSSSSSSLLSSSSSSTSSRLSSSSVPSSSSSSNAASAGGSSGGGGGGSISWFSLMFIVGTILAIGRKPVESI